MSPPHWMRASATILGGPARVARDGERGSRFAVIPAPAYPSPVRTLERRLDAISLAYTGTLEAAVDIYRHTVEEDGFFDGILTTMAHGLLGLPVSCQGDPQMCVDLLDASGSAGDFARMHPIEECAKIVKDGIGFGLGLGQYLETCWRCFYTDFDACDGIELCRRCHARRTDRPAGQRRLYQLQWRDIRSLRQIPYTYQWQYSHRGGLANIVDGDGEWMIYRTVPSQEPWRHGPWVWATLGAIFSRDAQYDAQNTSAVCAPTPVLFAKAATTPGARDEAYRKLQDSLFENKMVLSGEWDYKIVSADATYIEICETIVNRCSDAFETGITGNVMGRAAKAAFTDASIYARVTASRRAFYCGTWTRQLRDSGLVWWGLDNYGTRNVPVLSYDVRSPEDKLAEYEALAEAGTSIKAASDGYSAVGYKLDPSWIEEDAQRRGVRIVPMVATAPLAPGSGAPPVADASVDGDDAPQPDDAAARLAERMTTHGVERCEHGSSNRCRMCGVERLRDFEVGDDGCPSWRVAWRSIGGVSA